MGGTAGAATASEAEPARPPRPAPPPVVESAPPPAEPAAAASTDMLAEIAFYRARHLSPVLFFAMSAWCLVLQFTERPALLGSIVNCVTGAIVGITAIIARRDVSPRWGHLLCGLMWCCPVSSTLVGAWLAPEPIYAVLLPLEMVGAAVLLDTRWVIGLMIAVQAFWIPLSLRANAHDASLFLMTATTAQVFALVMQIIIRRALVVHANTARELKLQLAERMRLEDQLLHSQRMDAVGTLAAGLAHDMNNVLGSITSFAGLLDDEVRSASGRADLDQIVAQSMRGAELTRGLLAFSQHGKYRKQALGIDEVVLEVLPILERTLPRSIAIRHELHGRELGVEGDPTQLHQVLVNLAVNAAHAMSNHGELVISADVVSLQGQVPGMLGLRAGRHARFRVIDTGTGMDDATRRRVFEPFFTTKSAGKGTGLGLSTAWGIVQSHHGAITVDSTLGKGSTFTFYLPVIGEASAKRAPAVTDRTVRPVKVGTVLIADDEPVVLAGTARIVQRMGGVTLQACNGEQALDLHREHAPEIDLVILDMVMPVMGGAECFRRLRENSQVPVLISTGYAVDADVQEMVARGAGLIEKPYRSNELIDQVVKLLDGKQKLSRP